MSLLRWKIPKLYRVQYRTLKDISILTLAKFNYCEQVPLTPVYIICKTLDNLQNIIIIKILRLLEDNTTHLEWKNL